MADINLGALWTSSTGNGVTDDTAIFKQALQMAQGGTLYIPKSSVAYSISNISIPSNVHIVFEAGTVVQANAGLPANTALINLNSATNVTIDGNGVEFKMLKTQYTLATGEGTHVFSLQYGSSNIALNGIKVTSSGGGDGFYINNASNVTVSGCTATNCTRNGITVISGTGITVQDSIFSHNGGGGMRMEPNGPQNVLHDIVFQNCLSEYNASEGVGLGINQYSTATSPITLDVTLNNITTRYNGTKGLFLSTYTPNSLISGSIAINNYTSNGDNIAISVSNNGSMGPSVIMNSWNILNPTSYFTSIANYKGAAWVRELSAVTTGKINFTQGTFTATVPTGTTTTPTTTTPTTTTPTTSSITPTITGTTSKEMLNGTSSNDIMDGKGGNDTLYGGGGKDIYIAGNGYGSTLISSSSSNAEDTIMFNAGLTISNLSAKLVSNSQGYQNLVINYGSTDSVTVQNWNYNSGTALNTVQFAGSNTQYKLTMTNGVASWSPTTSSTTTPTTTTPTTTTPTTTTPTTSSITPTITGTTGNDTLKGTSSNDIIAGLAGNDVISGNVGNDTLWGGAGIDNLTGGSGKDIYLVGKGDGADLITSSSSNFEDTIMFNSGISLSDLSVKLVSVGSKYKNLVIGYSATDSITVQSWDYSAGTKLTTVQFAGSDTKYKLTMTNGVASWATIA